MNSDIRLWYHLLYITDQIKAADQKAYISMAVVSGVFGFSLHGFSWVYYYLASGNTHFPLNVLISIIILLCVGGLLGTLREFYKIIFPKIKSQKYIKDHQRSAIFWQDVAKMSFEDFKKQYMEEDRGDDLVVQIYVLSKIAEIKFHRIRRLFAISILTILFDVILLSISKIAQQ